VDVRFSGAGHQYALESLLVAIMVLPLVEIADMPLARLIDAAHASLVFITASSSLMGNQHGAILALLTLRTGFHFLSDPSAPRGIL